MASSGGAILAREEENDNEVRREDQDNINKFGRLNARLHEIRDTRQKLKKQLEGIEDASTELMMGNGDKVMMMLGEAFIEIDEDEATEHCEEQVEKLQETMDELGEEETGIVNEQAGLKKILYSRFGKSINLEEK
mmetsp:Transcript_11898/g.14393  ORF Transcript_11898/g.14393 Transcript_11898/m.14393 type:complete len:135 (+) Transcript_11898:88-492(+)|eukprot:CAMPEP_0195245914 /NCGR_PEP_ID=MMETSP0706-20130129/109_1 /TAXON_ID=33640 /ORGANISM="Asterionellopsis glacialis, Strain CCMP134" /LENGTH=134 /DNA_ID=CAMNT_0040297227 /DNA_START=39 /DNA_END=443 /DNA_ORIENTATION=+